MGRSLLIMCMGAIVIFGMVQQAVQKRQLTFTESNVETFNVSHARNATSSGLEMGINRVLHDNNWDDIERPWLFPIDDMNVRVFVDRNDDFPDEVPPTYLRVRSEYEAANRPLQAFAFLKRGEITPPVEGAVGFYGEGSRLNLSGNAKIYGHDTTPSGDPVVGDASDTVLPGIVSVDTEDELIDQSGTAATYEGDPNFLHNEELDGQEIHDLMEMYKSERDPYVEGNLGTVDNPRITVLEENQKIRDNTNAGGILIITEGTTLELRGDFMFEGLVLVEGTLDIRGNVHIFGAMMFTDNSLLEIDDPEDDDATFTGNTSIYYSSKALMNVNDKLSWRFEQAGTMVDRIFY